MNQRKAGVILSYLSVGASSIIQLLYVPMLLHYLTKDQYGIYQLMGSMVAYLAIMDFGLSNTTTRYLSQAYAAQDEKRANDIIHTSGALYAVIALLIALIGGCFYFFIDPIYGRTLSAADLLTAKQIFVIMLFNFMITIYCNVFVATINAHERFVFLRGLNLLKILLQPLLVWGILAWKASVINVVLVQTFFIVCVNVTNYLYCKYKLHIAFALNYRNRALIKELTGFSVFVFLYVIMDQVYWRLGQLVLGAVSGAAAVANYAIAMQLILAYTFIPSTMGGVFLPKLSSIVAKTGNLDEINNIFCKLGRLQFMAVMLLFVGFMFLGKVFINLWVGSSYGICYKVAAIIMAAYILDVAQNIGIPILQALKKHAFRAYVYITMAVLNIALCIPMAKRFGEIGCAWATAICLCLGSGVAINWYYGHIGLDLKRFFGNLGRICLGIVPAVLICLGIFYCFPLHANWFSFIWHGGILVIIYGCCLWVLALNSYEKQLVYGPLRKVHKLLFHH